MRDSKAITSSINAIAKAGKKLDDQIQAVGLECIEHAELHSDASLCGKLFLAMPQGSRRNALVAWFLQYGPIKVATGKNKDSVPLLWMQAPTDLAGAASTPWFKFKPEKAIDEEFDFDKQLQSFLAKVQKAVDAGTFKGDAAKLTAIKAVL